MLSLRSVKYIPVLTATLVACSGGDWSQEALSGDELGELEQAVTLMDKPGTEAALFTEAGQDIEQSGVYTVYSANADSHSPNTYEGSVHLFKNDLPLRSYQARTPFPYTRVGYQVAMSSNFIVTDVNNYPAGGQLKNAMMIIRKINGEFASCGDIAANGSLPNCVTCTGTDAQATCTPKAGVSILDLPTTISGATFELEGDDLLVATRYGGSTIVPYIRYGTGWTASTAITAPIAGELIGGAMSISGNRLAVSAKGPDATNYVYVYERANATSAWVRTLRVNSPNPSVPKFGERLDLSGNTLVASDQTDVHFIELSTSLANPAAAIAGGCTARTQTDSADVAISGSRVVVASTYKLPLTFERTNTWKFHGGLPSGMFPEDVDPQGNPTQLFMWGAALDGNRATIGWRNYRGDNPATETGAALGFDFTEYACGSQMGVPGVGLVYARALAIGAVSATSTHAGYPVTNAIDGSPGTRWRGNATANTQFEIDLGELERLNHLQLDWGGVYARDYLIQISSDPDSVPANQRTWDWLTHVTNGDGSIDFVALRNNAQAFGRRLRITMNAYGGAGEAGVSLTEVKAYGKSSDACSSKPTVVCNDPATAQAP